jgi:hypothetical protein
MADPAWDDIWLEKDLAHPFKAGNHNDQVADQKNHHARHAPGGSDSVFPATGSAGYVHQAADGTLALSNPTGAGDVVGPAGATDGHMVVFDGSSGKAVKDGGSPSSTDSNAIHKTTSGEIAALTEKTTPVSADLLVIEDSAASNAKKKVQIGNLPGSGSGEANTASNLGTSGDGSGLYASKSGVDLRFKRIKAGSNISLTEETNDVVIAASGGGGSTSVWNPLTATTDFATAGASSSTITMNSNQTGNIAVGDAIKYVFNENTYRGQITALTSSLMTFRGPPITTGAGLLTAVSWARAKDAIVAIPVLMPRYYEAATVSTYIDSNLLSPNGYEWELSRGYCIGFTFQTATADGSSNGQIQLVVNGNNVCSTATAGITVSSTSLLSTGVAINVVSNTNITIDLGQFFEISVTKGTGGNATNGRLVALFVVDT